MRPHFLLCLSICFLFSSLTHSRDLNSKGQLPAANDLVNLTCRRCSDISGIFDYNFCVNSIQAVPVSRTVALRGLAIVAMELALQNATNTISIVEKLILGKTIDPQGLKCLKDCLEGFADAISNVVMAMGAFVADQFATANLLMSSVVGAPMSCEAEFRKKKGEFSPLAQQNYNLFELGALSVCIIQLASLEPAPPM